MSGLSDFFKTNADTLGNDILSRIGDAAGIPSLPPLQFSDPYTNENNYVGPRPEPAQTQPETTPVAKTNWMLYGGIALGVIIVVGLVVRK